MADILELKKFREINIESPFFSSLKEDYHNFAQWFANKADEKAYIFHSDNELTGFMYLKNEDADVADVIPTLPAKHRIKIGTFKVIPHGTKLGQRLLKKAFDHAICYGAEELYLTVFHKHQSLIQLLSEFGFIEIGEKTTEDGSEKVYLKTLTKRRGDIRKDYPLFYVAGNRKFLLSIRPEWHSKLFPDSILRNEPYDSVHDVSHTNSIEKTYVCFMDLSPLSHGDLIVIYRTKDDKGSAHYRSVATSICTIDEVKNRRNFESVEEYLDFTEPYSVFNRSELLQWWTRTGNLYVIKMLYNAALSRRVIRKQLIEEVGLPPEEYWGFMKISDEHFMKIIGMGGLNERLVVDQT
jgi:predicted GNAT family N-acyltransferase